MKPFYLSMALLLITMAAYAQNLAQTATITSNSTYSPISRLTDTNDKVPWLTSPTNAAGQVNVTILLTKNIYTTIIDIYSANRAFSLEISSDGITWKSMKSFTAGSATNKIKINNGGVAFNRIRLLATLAANTQLSIGEIEITESPVKTVTAQSFSINGPTNAFDGSAATYYEYAQVSAPNLTFNINLTDDVQAAKVRINASENNIKVNLTDLAGVVSESYYNTLLANEEFVIINPQKIKTINLSKTITALTTLNVYEIDVTSLNFTGTSMGFAYNAAGCMTTRTILFPSTKSARFESADTIIPYDKPLLDMFANNNVLIYPNPTKGQLKVAVENKAETDKVSVTLFNMQGTQIHQNTFTENESTIDITNSPSGTYMLNITINGETHNWIIIKQ